MFNIFNLQKKQKKKNRLHEKVQVKIYILHHQAAK